MRILPAHRGHRGAESGKAEVKVLTTPDKWYGITYREDKPELMAALRRMEEDGLYPAGRLF